MPASAAASVTVTPVRRVRGSVRVPGDKSISHRYALLGAVARGTTRIAGFAPGADCASTLSCLSLLGVRIDRRSNGEVLIDGEGLGTLRAPAGTLDAGNSGSTARMLTGILAACPFATTLTGDASLSRRPMRRVITPLERMGARIDSNDGRLPITIHGARLHSIDFEPEVASAQVKSAVLLAGLHASGVTVVREPVPTRDHTERALTAFGATVARLEHSVSVVGAPALRAGDLNVPGDVSSSTFWAVAAAGLPGSDVEMPGVGMNPTRTAIFDVLRRAGADVTSQLESEEAGEPRGRVRIRHAALRDVRVTPAEVPGLIDEIPALAALATFGGRIEVRGAAELRAKESDRLTSLVAGLVALGADAQELPDGLIVEARGRLRGGRADACGDHRLAMALAVAALGAAGPSVIDGADAVDVSYPGFFDVLRALGE